MPLDTLFSNPNPEVPRPRSLLSRFKGSKAKLSRYFSEFDVRLQDPYKHYRPGEIIKGHVILVPAKGLDITHLVIALHGYAKIYRTMVVPGEGAPEPDLLVNGKGKSGFAYHGKGLATLFQDEAVLCGSGFLKRSVYEFGFELEFPTKGLPSSIDFERGTISYVISATVTRPTSMAPTTTTFRPVKVKDEIDIGSLSYPRSRTISLEPLIKRGRVRKIRHSPSLQGQSSERPPGLSRRDTDRSIVSTTPSVGVEPPRSPAPSEATIGTITTASSHSFNIIQPPLQTGILAVNSSDARSTNTSTSAHTISATTEILKQGVLPGDMIPLRILVQHTKPARGVIIATLYRQSRVDMHPAIPVTMRDGKERDNEDIFPKSRTGLGSLQFASGSPSSLFRMDLAQTSTIMIVDPTTLIADVRPSIRVPSKAIPTITNVPGDMMSFKYYVEVILDLCGKLNETRLLPSLTSNGPNFTYVAETSEQMSADWGNNILDTSEIRRTKSVACLKFSVIVGTSDSSRLSRTHFPNARSTVNVEEVGGEFSQYYEGDGYEDDWTYDGSENCQYTEQEEGAGQYYHEPTQFMPLPEPEEEVDEKTRLRREEAYLLPSQPPQEGQSSRTDNEEFAPSAPFIPGVEGVVAPHNGHVMSPSGLSTRSADTVTATAAFQTDESAEQSTSQSASEDKQELERQRLMTLVSSPPDDSAVADAAGPSGLSATAPPAPDLAGNGYPFHPLAIDHENGHEQLPVYQR